MFHVNRIQLQFPVQSWNRLGVAPFSSLSSTYLGNNVFQKSTPHPLLDATDSSSTQEQRRHRSNRSRRHLYDGKDIRTGNNLSFSMKHTKRTFKPNVFIKRVYSETLDEMVRFHLTTSALKSIDKMGGLDNYLLSSPHVTSGEGLKVKKRIINRLKLMERIASRKQESGGEAVVEAK